MNTEEKNNKPLSEQIAEKIKDYIITNDLKPGDKIPPEKDLIIKMEVGRSTVREAVKYLVSRNVLEIRHGAGTFITANVGLSNDPLGIEFIKDKQKLTHDLLEIRLIVEPAIAALAAKKATAQDIEELEKLMMIVEEKLLAGKEYVPDDIMFHQKIAQISKNLIVPKLTPIISQAVVVLTTSTKKQLREETVNMHREILNAIKEHDSIWAQDAMQLHLVYNRQILRKIQKEEMNFIEEKHGRSLI